MAIEYAQVLAQADIAPTASYRGYRVGQTRFLRHCIEELLTTSRAPVDVLATLQIVESVSIRLDRVVEQVYAVYETARELKLRDRSAVLTGRVRDILRDAPVDLDVAEVAARPIAFVNRMWRSTRPTRVKFDVRSATSFCHDARRGIGMRRSSSFVDADERSAWAWLPTCTDVALLPSLRSGQGRPDRIGRRGRTRPQCRRFPARSHRQAISAGRRSRSRRRRPRPDHTVCGGVHQSRRCCAPISCARVWVSEALVTVRSR